MNERIRPTRSGLFAIELLISTGVFAMCAAICVGLFVRSEVMSRESAELTRAVNEARGVVECFHAAGGDPVLTAQLCGGTVRDADSDGAEILVCYDADWNRLDTPPAESITTDPVFMLHMLASPGDGYTSAVVQLGRYGSDGATFANEDRILLWHVSALHPARTVVSQQRGAVT